MDPSGNKALLETNKLHSGISFFLLNFVSSLPKVYREESTLLGINISHPKTLLKMIFLFPRWDMLISWRVFRSFSGGQAFISKCKKIHHTWMILCVIRYQLTFLQYQLDDLTGISPMLRYLLHFCDCVLLVLIEPRCLFWSESILRFHTNLPYNIVVRPGDRSKWVQQVWDRETGSTRSMKPQTNR